MPIPVQAEMGNYLEPLANRSSSAKMLLQLINGVVYGIALIQVFQTAADSYTAYVLNVEDWGDSHSPHSYFNKSAVIIDNLQPLLDALSMFEPVITRSVV